MWAGQHRRGRAPVATADQDRNALPGDCSSSTALRAWTHASSREAAAPLRLPRLLTVADQAQAPSSCSTTSIDSAYPSTDMVRLSRLPGRDERPVARVQR